VPEPILVVAETRDGAPTSLTRELLGLARALADESAGEVAALLISTDPHAARDLIAHGADRVYVSESAAEDYEGERWLAIAGHVAKLASPRAILAGHTAAGADLVPRLAFRLESAAATGCVGITIESGTLMFTRPCYGGNVRETISFTSIPALATVKAGAGTPKADEARQGEVIPVIADHPKPRTRVVARERETAGAMSLEDARTIVAGGRGLEGPDGFRVLEDLAGVLDAAVGASRVPCDLGWCPHSWQIGLTGKTVTPDLYFAIGISGAGHHMAGCGNARTIVAINSDPEAAIFRDARFGVVGDYRKIVPALTKAVTELKKD